MAVVVGAGFFQTGHRYQRTDLADVGSEFWCVSVAEAPQPGALGRFAFGFQIERGEGQLHRWLPAVQIERTGVDGGTWVECGVF